MNTQLVEDAMARTAHRRVIVYLDSSESPVHCHNDQGTAEHCTLTGLQTRLIKTGGRLVRHTKRLVVQLAGALATREMLARLLERIARLRLAPR